MSERIISMYMSQDSRAGQNREKEMSQAANEGSEQKDYEGFEGMNYEQFRQPYNPKHKGRNNNKEERNDSKRPDES